MKMAQNPIASHIADMRRGQEVEQPVGTEAPGPLKEGPVRPEPLAVGDRCLSHIQSGGSLISMPSSDGIDGMKSLRSTTVFA